MSNHGNDFGTAALTACPAFGSAVPRAERDMLKPLRRPGLENSEPRALSLCHNHVFVIVDSGTNRHSQAIMNEVTQILDAVCRGESQAAERLLPLVYDELRELAAQRLAQEKPGQTLQATALVHEAYLRLVGKDDEPRWDGRGHFFAAAAEAMRRILVEQARRKRRQKRGGGLKRAELFDAPAPEDDDRLLALDEALTRLAEEDPQAARVVELRHFAGLGHNDVAATLGITVYQARQKWAYARAWLSAILKPD
jgi:RNA polymerase sigma factor (TIGR02999 family)